MKFKYYGTAAAEAVPALFCECDVCTNARKKGGKNIRTRSQALVDDKILIDFSPDTYLHVLMYGLPLHKISTCIITHNHSDHLCPSEIFMRHKIFSHLKDNKPFSIYGTQAVIDVIRNTRELCEYIDSMIKDGEIELHTIKKFEPFYVEDFKITALSADHGAKDPVIYMIEKDGKSMLYAHDTGLFPDDTIAYLENIDICFDFVSFDCTNVLLELDNRGHMGITGNEIMREKLKRMGRIDEHTKCVINHFSHNGLAGYDELVAIAQEREFDIAYDTMEFDI